MVTTDHVAIIAHLCFIYKILKNGVGLPLRGPGQKEARRGEGRPGQGNCHFDNAQA